MKKIFHFVFLLFLLGFLTGCLGLALHNAASQGDDKAIIALLKEGQDINAKQLGFSDTPLHLAAKYGNLSSVKLLLDGGAKIDIVSYGGWTPLIWSSMKGHAAVSKLLIERGADTGYAIDQLTKISKNYIGDTKAEAQRGINIINDLIGKRSEKTQTDTEGKGASTGSKGILY